MGRIAIPVTELDRDGATPAAQVDADTASNHWFANAASRTWLEVVSSDGADQTVEFELHPLNVTDVDGVTLPAKTVTVPAGATRLFGPFPNTYYNQIAATAADGTLISDATAPANNATVTIDGHVYTFKTTLSGAADEVLIGASAAAALTNLKAAINGAAGAGTTYGTFTIAHETVEAGALTSTTLFVSARSAGEAGNALATTETSSHLAWGAATLSGGVEARSSVFVNPSVDTTLKFRAYSLP